MVSHSRILHYSARLASISKGKSLNDRDINCRINFHHSYCDIISGGLFAICCLRLPVDCESPFSVELNNQTIQSVASELNEVDCQITKQESGAVRFGFDGSFIDAVDRNLWDHFQFNANFDNPCVLTKDVASAIFTAVPKLLSDAGESTTMAAMRLQASNGSMLCSSTDMKVAVKVVVPCKGDLKPILIPFAAVSILKWAVAEFGELDSLAIALDGEQVAIKCGPFQAIVKQPGHKVPDIDQVICRLKSRLTNSVDLSLEQIASAASLADNMGYESCRLVFDVDSRVEAGDTDIDRFAVAIEAAVDTARTLKLNPSHVVTAASCMSKLRFDKFSCRYGETKKDHVLMLTQRDGVTVEVAIAQME